MENDTRIKETKMSEQNNNMEKFLQYLEKFNSRLDKLEDLLEISKDGQKRKQDRLNAQKAISLKNQQEVKIKDAVYPLTPCGVIPYPIAVGNTTIPLPLNSVDNYPNQVDGFPTKFGMSLEDGSGLPVTLAQINACLYTATLASVWFTTGQKPSWQQSVIDRNGGYNQGAEIRQFQLYDAQSTAKGYGYYLSKTDNNINIAPDHITGYTGWWMKEFWEVDNTGNSNGFLKYLNLISTWTGDQNAGSDTDNGYTTTIRPRGLTIQKEGDTSTLDQQHLEFRNANGDIEAFFSADQSQTPKSTANQFIDATRDEKLGNRVKRYENGANNWQQSFYLGGKSYIINGMAAINNGSAEVVLFASIILPNGQYYPVKLTPLDSTDIEFYNYHIIDNKTFYINALDRNHVPISGGTMAYSLEVELI